MLTLLTETGIFSSITGAYSDMIGTNTVIDSKEVRAFVESFIATDEVAIKAVSKDGKTTIETLTAWSFFETIENGVTTPHEIALYNEKDEKYAFIRSFYDGYNEVKLYHINNHSLEEAKEVPLNTLQATAHLENIEKTNLKGKAVFLTKKWENYFAKIETLANSIDRKMNELEAEFYKHLDSYVIFKGLDVPTEAVMSWKIDKATMGKMFFAQNNEADIQFITNNNPMIEKAMEFVRKDIERISAITKVPIEFLGEAMNEWAVGSESRRLRMSLFYAKIINIREAIEEAYEAIFGEINFNWSEIVGYNDTKNNE